MKFELEPYKLKISKKDFRLIRLIALDQIYRRNMRINSKLPQDMVAGAMNRISLKDLIADLKRFAKLKKSSKLSKLVYDQEGKYCSANYLKKFGLWHDALKAASLEISS